MKILWVNANFLHPTTKGGQIRTLEMLRRLNQRHEVHYAAFEDPEAPEGVRRAGEYCRKAYPFRLRLRAKTSLAFALDLAQGLISPVPLAVSRFATAEMRRFLDGIGPIGFDRVVCDFLAPAANFSSLRNVVLFQHNVETVIWQRRVEQARNLAERWYVGLQAKRMKAYEGRKCREAGRVVAVSQADGEAMRRLFGVTGPLPHVPTGVDVSYFTPPEESDRAGLVFVGSMDWLPNIDGIGFFVEKVLPKIRARLPRCSLTIVGRKPPAAIQALAAGDPLITVTGTVPDVRPYLWAAAVSVVPLRIGGGTRLKIYEAMAAGAAVVSTTIGAEGLPLTDGEHIALADDAEGLAARCCALLEGRAERTRMARAAWERVAACFSWDTVVSRFEEILEQAPAYTDRERG